MASFVSLAVTALTAQWDASVCTISLSVCYVKATEAHSRPIILNNRRRGEGLFVW